MWQDIDAQLWNEFREGEAEAYEQLYTYTVQELFRFGLLYTADRELVKDCIHDLFVKLYTHRKRLSPTDDVPAYLCLALKNTLLNALKHSGYSRSFEEAGEEGTVDSPEYTYIAHEEQCAKQRRLYEIIASLPERQREIIYYRYVRNMTIDEIARLTDMNYQSVANIIQRALKKIRTLYHTDNFRILLLFLLQW